MRRLIIASILSIAAVAPGIAWQAGQDRETPRNWDRIRDRQGQSPLERTEQLRTLRRGADLLPLAPTGLCQPNFGSDISSAFYNAPGNGWMVIPGECGSAGCNQFFVITCSQGSVIEASFCSNGGQAFWNTNLSVWDGGNLEFCDDDTCGQQSDMFYPYVGNAYHRVRIGGTNGESGSYLLAVNIPANCFIGPPIGVELQSFDVQ